jgi:hypothetical protein
MSRSAENNWSPFAMARRLVSAAHSPFGSGGSIKLCGAFRNSGIARRQQARRDHPAATATAQASILLRGGPGVVGVYCCGDNIVLFRSSQARYRSRETLGNDSQHQSGPAERADLLPRR